MVILLCEIQTKQIAKAQVAYKIIFKPAEPGVVRKSLKHLWSYWEPGIEVELLMRDQ